MEFSKLARTALVYDFDGTLAKGNIQEHTFLPELGVSPETFWSEVKRLTREHDADEILIYMWHMLGLARTRHVRFTEDFFRQHGNKTPLFDGLETWFDRINDYGARRGLAVEHYVISSGTHEMIEGSAISDRFSAIYASRFLYDSDGRAVWPAVAINYTNKTQFLFRINKGIPNTWDNLSVNRYIPEQERPVPFSRMVFFGDGDTDIPSMKMVRHQGGHSIAVFDPDDWHTTRTQEKVYKLIAEDRAHFTVPADYREGSHLDVTVKGVIGRIARAEGYRGEGESQPDGGIAAATDPKRNFEHRA